MRHSGSASSNFTIAADPYEVPYELYTNSISDYALHGSPWARSPGPHYRSVPERKAGHGRRDLAGWALRRVYRPAGELGGKLLRDSDLDSATGYRRKISAHQRNEVEPEPQVVARFQADRLCVRSRR